MPTLSISYGNAVTGKSRFERPDLQADFIAALESSGGIKMFGLRRIGKSTMRLFATEYCDANKQPYIGLDGQGLASLGDLLREMHSKMPGDKGIFQSVLGALGRTAPARAALDALITGNGQDDAALAAYWQLLSGAITTALADADTKPWLVIDEFTWLLANMIKRDPVNGGKQAEQLLAAMRGWRGAGMKMLLTGSIGLIALARQYGLSTEHLNDLIPFEIPELTQGEAREFIHAATSAPAAGGGWTDAHIDAFLAETGVLYPSFLVRGLNEIGKIKPPPPEAFEDIFSAKIRPKLHADFYDQFDRRFKAYQALPDDEQAKLILPALQAILNRQPDCADADIPCAAPFDLIDRALALDMLVEDGFVSFREDRDGNRRWSAASRLVRLWWMRAKLA